MPSPMTVSAIAFLATILTVPQGLGQPADTGTTPPPPKQGHQLGSIEGGWEIIVPFPIAQCEPVLIYYNVTTYLNVYAAFDTPDDIEDQRFLYLSFPRGIGYLDWICDVPAGYSFIARTGAGSGGGFAKYYTVQPGSSSACLGNITTSYSYATYSTTNFQSYTGHSASGNASYSDYFVVQTTVFPTDSFSTITANPNLAVTSTSTISSPSSSPDKSNKATWAAAGGVVGGVSLILLTLALIFGGKSYRKSRLKATTTTTTIELESTALRTSQRSVLVSGDYQVTQLSRGNEHELSPDIRTFTRDSTEPTPSIVTALSYGDAQSDPDF